MVRLRGKYSLLIAGVLLGVVYALGSFVIFGRQAAMASITYLFVVPAVLGIVPFLFADDEQVRSYKNIIFIPWLTTATVFLCLLMIGVEEVACLVILAAPFFIVGTLGALIYRLIRLHKEKSKNKLLTLLILPFLLAPVEESIKSPSAIFVIESEVYIAASPETVWNNIVSVDSIRESEYEAGFFNDIGIPRPISATVDKKQLGGRRVGNFEGGLRFIENIKQYEPNKIVAFDITIDKQSVRPKVFDQHVLNGNYFTFVDAAYRLTPLPDGQVKLRLSSNYQLTSKVNFYGKFWGDIILHDFQDRLLAVIAKRCSVEKNSLR